jgi:hypothetical protein
VPTTVRLSGTLELICRLGKLVVCWVDHVLHPVVAFAGFRERWSAVKRDDDVAIVVD